MDYTVLHKQIAEEFKITSNQVKTIRVLMLRDKLTVKKTIEHVLRKSDQPRYKSGRSKSGRRSKPKQHYLELAHFLSKITQPDLDKILRELNGARPG